MWKKLLLYTLICGGLWLFIRNITEIEHILIVVEHSHWQWIIVGLLCQLGYFLGYAFLYHETFDHVGVETDWQHLLPLTFTTLFVTLLAPFGGAGLAMYVDDANQRGKSGFKTALGVLLGTFMFLLTFSCVLAVGIFILHREKSLQPHEIFASGVVFVIVIGTMLVLWLGARHETFLHHVFKSLYHVYNGFIKHISRKWILESDWVTEKERAVRFLGQQVINNPLSLLQSLLITFGLHLLQILSLFCVTLAFQQKLTIGMLITTYSMAMLLVMISVVPQGVGLVEGVLTILLTSFGIEPQTALALMLVYRALSFGIPAIIGFILLNQLKTFQTT